jgi:hypothetical protein
LPVDNVIDRQDDYFAVGPEADAANRDRAEQAQAIIERKDREPGMISWVSSHDTPHSRC